MSKKLVLYVGPGLMATVFGAGVVTGLQNKGFRDEVITTTSTSGGALNLAYYVANQSDLGSRIYWEDLPDAFLNIDPWNLIHGTLQRFCHNGYKKSPPRKVINPMNLDYLFEIIAGAKSNKKLDIRTLQNQNTPVLVRTMNTETGRIEKHDITSHPQLLDVLRASVSAVPLCYGHPINGTTHIDAGIRSLGLEELIVTHPDKKIAIVLNLHPDYSRARNLMNHLGARVAEKMYPAHLSRFLKRKEIQHKLEIIVAANYPNVRIIHPPKNSPATSYTTNPGKLQDMHQLGINASQQLIDFYTESQYL